MNQILNTKLNKKDYTKKNWFKFQFGISIFLVFLAVFLILFYYYNLIRKENISNNLINNYSIYKLYANKNQSESTIEESFNGLFRNYRNT